MIRILHSLILSTTRDGGGGTKTTLPAITFARKSKIIPQKDNAFNVCEMKMIKIQTRAKKGKITKKK